MDVINELKEGLEKYGFRQKENNPLFFYDCAWYLIFAEIIEAGKNIFVTNGIQFLWTIDNLATIREETINDLNYYIKDFSPKAVDDVCKWINTKKEYYLEKYKNPEEMLEYLKNYDDMSHQPNGYIIARILKNKPEIAFFENTTRKRLEEINADPNNYLPYANKEMFLEIEMGINELMKMDDKRFEEEMNSVINKKRIELQLKTHKKYF